LLGAKKRGEELMHFSSSLSIPNPHRFSQDIFPTNCRTSQDNFRSGHPLTGEIAQWYERRRDTTRIRTKSGHLVDLSLVVFTLMNGALFLWDCCRKLFPDVSKVVLQMSWKIEMVLGMLGVVTSFVHLDRNVFNTIKI
jgi:hypothetical protein